MTDKKFQYLERQAKSFLELCQQVKNKIQAQTKIKKN